jgi:hypothetical protein
MKKFLVLAALALALLPSTAQAEVCTYGGDIVYCYLSGLNLGDQVYILTGSGDPTITAVDAPPGSLYLSSGGKLYQKQDAGLSTNWIENAMTGSGGGGGSGDVVGPASSSDNAIARFDGATGKLIQNSGATLGDTGVLTTNNVVLSAQTASRALVTDGSKQVVSSSTTSTQIAYLDTLTSNVQTQINGKEPTITATTTDQYYRGDKTFQTLDTSVVPENGNLYYEEGRVSANADVAANTAARHSAVTLGTANGLSLVGQELSLGTASSSTTGALTSTDWSLFNGKEPPITAGTTAQYWRGDKSFQTLDTAAVPENGSLYFTAERVDDRVAGLVQNGTGLTWTYDDVGNTLTGDVSLAPFSTSNLSEGSRLYYTEGRVSANTDVAANTAARHSAVTIGTANGLSLSTQQLSLALATTGAAGAMSSSDKTKLDGVATGATANQTDSFLLDRTNHTGTQTASTISDFTSAARTASVNDTAYNATSWDAVTDVAPSKNAVRDQIETMLTSIAGKEPTITAGTSSQYWRGDKTFQTLDTLAVPENTNQYFTTTRARASVSGTAPITYNSGTGAFGIDAFTGATSGSAGAKGAVPAPQAGDEGKYLKGDGSWATVAGGGSSLAVSDEGGSLTSAATSFNFVGGGVTATNVGSAVTVTVPADAVSSVNGQTGAVSLVTDDIAEDGAPVNLWFTDTRARTACVSDTAYNAGTWDAVTNIAPSKNAVRDQIETMLTSIASKEPSITSGTSLQYWRGDKTFQTLNTAAVPESGNLYYTDTRAKTAAVSDTAYNATSWDGVTDVAASKNAVRDKLEAIPTEAKTYSNLSVGESTFYITDSIDPTKRLRINLSLSGSGDATLALTGAPGDTFTLPDPSNPIVFESGAQTINDKFLVTDTTALIDGTWGSEIHFDMSGGGILSAGQFVTFIINPTGNRSITFPDRSGEVPIPQTAPTAKGDLLAYTGSTWTTFAGSGCTNTQMLEKDSTTTTGWKCVAKPTGTAAPISEVSVAFTDGETSKRVTVTDASVSSTSKIMITVRRPDTTAANDAGYRYTTNVITVATGSFDVVVDVDGLGQDDVTEIPPNETIKLYYQIN